MKHRIALAAIAAALALASPALAGPSTTARSTSTAPASRQVQVQHRSTTTQTQAVEGLYRRAQQKLVDMHLYTGAVDGRRSDGFVRSLEQFQRAHNIRANGRLNSETRAALGI